MLKATASDPLRMSMGDSAGRAEGIVLLKQSSMNPMNRTPGKIIV
jgi:hypothetical protein